ncbi:hypothetical protein K1719_015393 [Acacia pycnantha]|nr:hypothetical protein K1719_015393 [Acacia pycnantha]
MSGCGSYEGHVMGACACGMFHSQTNSFPMHYTNNQNSYAYDYDDSDMYSSFTPSSSSVDCTLSLGTPSTRLTHHDEDRRGGGGRSSERRRSVSNMRWDSLQSNQSHSSNNKSGKGGSSSSNDPLLARRCANCDTTSTPLWRNGPRGPKSLCNACGIRYKKEERRAAAAATASASSGGVMESQAMYGHQDNYWYAQSPYSQGQVMPCYSPGMMEDGNGDSDNGMAAFLSWRLNVTDRPSLVHDFTR